MCSIPATLKELRACNNCDDFLHLKHNRDKVFECTSANFDGMIAMMDPTDSWVAKWQRLGFLFTSVLPEKGPEFFKRIIYY